MVISSKVNIPYASAFEAGLIAMLDRQRNSEVTKKSAKAKRSVL
jgi:hypothetical protein